LIIRTAIIFLLAYTGYFLTPFKDAAGRPVPAAGGIAGLALGMMVILFELRATRISLRRLIGAAAGSLLGILGAFLMGMVLDAALTKGNPALPFMQVGLLLWMTYIGLVIGASKGEVLNLSALGGIFHGDRSARQGFKILDTSVIIDGRIADVAETGFTEGTLVVPQFVLRELQLVADSADSLKRNRGRRGLDILQRLQKMAHLNIQILEDDYPHLRDVDLKLIELAKHYECKIVTNDFNLNKMAQLHGVRVLNINELANALKPVVLPGETMRVFILKEGKEYNQGVAYLDDGTMVVVDNAKKVLSKTIDITVTSVLQTTAGKMIFGRFDERVHAVHEKGPPERPERGPHREAAPTGSAAAG
jgi:uncharacterized protein YacL